MDASNKDIDNAATPDTRQESKSLGEMLVEANLLTQKQLEYTQELQQSQGKKLSEVLLEQRFVSPEDLTAVVSVQMNVPFIDLKRHVLQPEALKLVTEVMARKYTVVPLDIVGDALVVVMADP